MPYIKVMPKGPQGQKRPADVIGAAIRIARIATGEAEETPETNPQKVKAGKLGGKNRAETLSVEKRKEFAKKAADTRWAVDFDKD